MVNKSVNLSFLMSGMREVCEVMSNNHETRSPPEPRYRIGMASRLSGVPPHNLRKWESRYGVVNPQRTPGGGRLYSTQDVERLSRARHLVDAGMDISEVARLDDEQLDELLHALGGGAALASSAGEAGTTPTPGGPASPDVLVIGNALSTVMSQIAHENPRIRLLGSYVSEQDVPADAVMAGETLLVLEQTGLHPDALDRIQELASRLGARGTLVFYNFASRGAIAALDRGNIRAVAMPPSAYDVERDVFAVWGELVASGDGGASAPRFTEHALATIAQASPTVACECPRHIASILMTVQAFERYSAECIIAQPDDAALHERLRDTAAAARSLLEGALVDVARADGMDLAAL